MDTTTTDMLVVAEPVLERLRGSCRDPRHGEWHPEPVAGIRRAVIRLCACRTVGAILAYAAHGSHRRPDSCLSYLRSLRRFEETAIALDPAFACTDERAVTATLDAILEGRGPAALLSPSMRDTVCRETRIALRRVRRFCLSPLSDALLRAAAPAEHVADGAFDRRLRARHAEFRAAGRKRRKRRADRISNAYDRLVDGAAFRAKQVSNDGRNARVALALLASAPPTVTHRDFEVLDDELDGRGLPTGRLQRRTWRCWRTAAAWSSLRDPAASVRRNGGTIHYRARNLSSRSSEPEEPFVFELIALEAADGKDSIAPWYLDLHASQVLVSAGHLDWRARERRHAAKRRLALAAQTGTARGLLTFERDRATLARLALEHPQPRHFLPLEEFEHAMLLAAHGLDSVVQTWCRSHEFMQQTAYLEDWQRDPEDRNALDEEDAEWGFKCLRKAAAGDSEPDRPDFLVASEGLFTSAMTIVGLLRRRAHGGGDIPCVAPAMAGHKLSPQPYVFSYGGRALRHHELTLMLRVLFAGMADVRFHDFRHSASTVARAAGVPLGIVQAGLGNRSIRLARYYSRLTAEQRSAWDTEALRLRRAALMRPVAARPGGIR